MQIKRRQYFRFALGAVALITVIVALMPPNTPEPKYQGILLSEWLDGTMYKRGASSQKRVDVSEFAGPEAIPWLLQLLERREGLFERQYLRFYGLARTSGGLLPNPRPARMGLYGPARTSNAWLPEPRLPRIRISQFNAARLLSQLAPGTEYEDRVVTALLSPNHKSERQYLFRFLGAFTNSSERIIPVLLNGVTNPPTFDASVASLQRFGTKSAPFLYRMARTESGHIRPAGLALEMIDATTYQRLCDEKDTQH